MEHSGSHHQYDEALFGIVLRSFRKRLGISQESLALNSGLDRTYISLLERGLRQPTIGTFFALCYALKISPIDFIEALQIEPSERTPLE